MVGNVPPPSSGALPPPPPSADGSTEVNTNTNAEGASDVHASPDATTVQPENKTGLPEESGYEKSTTSFRQQAAPPNLSDSDKARWDQGVEVAEAMGPAGEAALQDFAQQVAQDPTIMADPEKFFAGLEKALEEHGAVPPPPGFHELEQSQQNALRMGSGGGGGSDVGGTTGGGGAQRLGSGGSTSEAQRLGGGFTQPTDTGSFREQVSTTTWAVLGPMNGQDIEAIAFLVLMQAAKSAQEDLKAIMAQVKAINNAKSKQRELLADMQKKSSDNAAKTGSQVIGGAMSFNKAVVDAGNPSNPTGYLVVQGYQLSPAPNTGGVTKAQLDAAVDKAKSDLDSMSEMGEMESLRLQMAMDRMSKMMSTLSNLLKKISDTANSITQNLK